MSNIALKPTPVSRTKDFLTSQAAQKGYWSVFDQVIVSGSNFFTGLLLGRYLPQKEFGVFVVAWTTLMIMLSVQNALITTPMSVIGARRDTMDNPGYFGSLLIFQLIGSLGLCLGLWLIALSAPVFMVTLTEFRSIFTLLGLISIFFLGQEFFRRLLIVQLDIKRALVNDAATHISRIAALFILLQGGLLNSTTCLIVVGFSSLLGCATGYRTVRSWLRISRARIKTDFLESWRFGKWVIAEMLPQTLSVQGYTYLTAAYVGYAEAAALGAAQNVLNATNIILVAYSNIMLPAASRRYSERGAKSLHQFMIKTGFLSAVPVLGFYIITMFYSEEILHLAYHNKYSGYGALLVVCSLYFMVSFFNRILQVMLYAKKQPDIGFIAKSLSLLVMVLLSFPLIRSYGVYGAAIGTVISQLIILMGVGYFVFRNYEREENY